MYEFCTFVIFFFVFLFGICIGSFLNVVIYRLENKISIVHGHSFCPVCKEKIMYRDLIPVLSFFLLGGKCRSCHHKISPRYPAIELTAGFFSLLCVYKFSFTVNALIVFLFLCALCAIFFIDLDTMIIPNELVLFLAAIAFVFTFTSPTVTLFSRFIGFFSISLFMILVNFIVKDSFGGGDVVLISVCGYILGWQNNLLSFFISLITASLISVWLLLGRKKNFKSHIPFGPHLCIGITVAFFYGPQIIKWYLSSFGL